MLILVLGSILMLAVSIFIHELGHLLCGMLVGVKARVFSMGYGRGIWKKKIGETVYQITAIPLGGYVLFKGDEYGEGLKGEKGELLSTPPFKRMIPVLGGPLFNLLMGFIIIFFLTLFGDRSPSNKIFIDESIESSSPAYFAGLRTSDRIVSINGKKIENFEDIFTRVGLSVGNDLNVEVEREGKIHNMKISPDVYTSGGRPTIGIEPFGERRVVATFTYSEQLQHYLSNVIDKDNKSEKFFREKSIIRDIEEGNPEILNKSRESEKEKKLRSRAITYLKDGDVIKTVEGVEVYTVTDLQKTLGKFQNKTVKVNLDRKVYPLVNPWTTENLTVEIPVLGADILELKNVRDSKTEDFIFKNYSLSSFDPKISTKLSNIKIRGHHFTEFSDLKKYLGVSQGKDLLIQVGEDEFKVDYELREVGLLGFRPSVKFTPEVDEKSVGIVEAFLKSIDKVVQYIGTTLQGIKMLFTGLISAKENLSGPIGIVQFAGISLEYGWEMYLDFVAKISIALMIMNLLPIPVADGGHLVLYLYEAITGRPLPSRAIDIIFRLGFLFLLAVGIFVSFNDIARFF
ncbi:MAG: site-2 protease family protein [Leptospiraceae bacterium]|nr:site-2 protease family protein [Leptospiraceae bacterium]MCK6380103.1 site-2 protease family protein [Leptospiraceae bacterium]NUM40524.1 site-2 protease family protein [Leptospiraceae bacterium]